jgi:hypothetical protein
VDDLARRASVVAAIAALTAAGCGSGASRPPIEKDLRRAVAEINTTREYRPLRTKLRATLAAIERADTSTMSEHRAKELTTQGVRSALVAVDARIAFVENDRGNLPIATRDATRAYHASLRAARLFRAAGEALGLRVGSIDGL